MNREVKDLVREIERRGWIVEQGRVHLKARKPGCGMVTISLTPNHPGRAMKNARADIRRAERAAQPSARATPVPPETQPRRSNQR